jgi:hypothetical protein
MMLHIHVAVGWSVVEEEPVFEDHTAAVCRLMKNLIEPHSYVRGN